MAGVGDLPPIVQQMHADLEAMQARLDMSEANNVRLANSLD